MILIIISCFIIVLITVNLEKGILQENENKNLNFGKEVREVNVCLTVMTVKM